MTLESDDGHGVTARVADFIESVDWSTVRQGVQLLLALGDSAALADLAHGLSIDDSDALEIPGEWRNRVRVSGENAENLALLLLARSSPSPLAELRELDLRDFEWLTDIEPLHAARKLEKLRLDGCRSLADGSPLGGLPSLRSVSAVGANFRRLPERGLEQLESLSLSVGQELSIAPIASMRSLRRLSLYDCHWVRDFAPLAALHKLQSLRIAGCGSVGLAPLGGLCELAELRLSELDESTDYSAISGLPRLRRLEFSRCPSLDLSKLLIEGALPALEELGIHDTSQLQGFRSIRGGQNIVRLDFSESSFCLPEPFQSMIDDSLASWRRSLPKQREGQAAVAALAALDALLRTGREHSKWPEVREHLAAAVARGGPVVAQFMLGGAVCLGGKIVVVTSSLARRAAESISAEWHDDAMLMLWDACGWEGVVPGESLDLSKARLVDRPVFTRLPPGTQVLLPDGGMIGNTF